MGRSEHDPSLKGERAWNARQKLGAKRALKPQQVWAKRFWLDSKLHLGGGEDALTLAERTEI